MKKILSMALAVLMVFGLFGAFPLTASAAADVDMNVTFSPTSLSTGGNIDLNVDVRNNGDAIQNAVLSVDGRNLKEFGDIGSGDVKTYGGEYEVATSKIGQDIKVVLTYEFEGAEKQVSQTIRVAKKEANVKVSAQVKASKESVPRGTKVTFTFAIENEGDTKIENATISASALNGGKAVCDAFSLAAGKSKVVTYVGEIQKSITVSPKLKYTAAGKTYTEDMSPIDVKMTEAELEVTAVAESTSVEAGAQVPIDVTIKNTGSMDLKNLKLTGPDGEYISLKSKSLAAGESTSGQYTATVTESTSLEFKVTAEDSEGEEYSFSADPVELEVAAAPSPSDYSQVLTLEVTKDESQLKDTGKVTFKLTLTNNGTEVFTNVVISEPTLGNIDSLATMAGGTREIAIEQEVKEDTQFAFKVTATDPAGNPLTIEATPIDVVVSGEAGSGLGTLMWIVIVVIVLIIATGVTLLILVRKDKKQKELEAARASKKRPGMPGNGRTVSRNPAARQGQNGQGTKRPAARPASEEDDILDLDDEDEEEYRRPDRRLRYDQEEESAPEPQRERPTVRRRPPASGARSRKNDFDDRNSF